MAIATVKKESPIRGRRPAGADNNRDAPVRALKFANFTRVFGGELKNKNQGWYESIFRKKIGRRMLIVLRIAALVGLIFTMLDVTLDYNESPTVTTMESDSYPARDIDFPGVAICSTNKMSLHAVDYLAEDLYSLESTKVFNVSFLELRDMLKYLGHLYMFDVNEDEIEDAQMLHSILTRAYGDYNIDKIMLQLTPKCRSILKHCSWEGKDRVCDNLFFLRKTQDGHCCTFNYARRSDHFGSTGRSGFVSSTVERSTLISPEYGLTVVLNLQVDDYYYKSFPSNGFKVMIYESLDYPDAPSGGLTEILVPEKSEVFVSMDAISYHSVPEVLEYDVSLRNCLFNTEQNKIFQGYYSYSDCIMYCRIRDILQLCKCIPFFYPRPDNVDSFRSCNLDDLLCLKEYVVKWRQIRPINLRKKSTFDDSDIGKNPASHLHCNCFPSCDDIAYKISSSKIPLTRDKLLWDRSDPSLEWNTYNVSREQSKHNYLIYDFRNIIKNSNYSILHVFFDGPNTIRLKQDVLFYWYELMSDYGGICSLFLGISIINVLEIIYVSLNLIFNRERRGIIIDPDGGYTDKVKTMQDADVETRTKTTKVMQDEVPRLNTVKVIDVHETTTFQRIPELQVHELYWREFVKPMNKSILNN